MMNGIKDRVSLRVCAKHRSEGLWAKDIGRMPLMLYQIGFNWFEDSTNIFCMVAKILNVIIKKAITTRTSAISFYDFVVI